jgi:hypothetical protein
MQKNRLPPLPFLVLLLCGLIAPIAILAGRFSPAPVAKEDTLQVQTVEQERMAAVYFRILSWLADVTPAGSPASGTAPQPSRAPLAVKASQGSADHTKVELCTLSREHKSARGNGNSQGSKLSLPTIF